MGIRGIGFRGRVALLGLACAALLVGPAAARADTATCIYDGGAHVATVSVTHQPASLGSSMGIRPSDGAFTVQSGLNSTPCGTANRNNLDTVNVKSTNAAGTGSIFRIPGSGLAPGFTDEAGGSDEIEMTFDFSSGGHWFLTPDASGSTTAVDMALGGAQINFNRSEADGVDADATVVGATSVFVYGSDAADKIIGKGGFGTSGPFAISMIASTGPGTDTIIGGRRADDLSGGLGSDIIFGGKGRDSLKGLGAKDRLFGQAGNDKLLGGAARDRLDGGAGRADACTTKGDRVRNCELPARNK